MAESPLHELDAWLPFAEALRRTAPDGTAETVFTGTLSPSSWGGSTLDDGDHEARWADRSRESRDLLHDAVGPLLALTGGREHGARVAVTATGDVRVRIVDIPVDASFSMSGGLGSIVLVEGACPEPYRREPVDHDRPASPDVDPGAVTALVSAALPDASGASAEALDAVEARLGRRLPSDVRALYLAAGDGELVLATGEEVDDEEVLYGLRIAPLDSDAARYLDPVARYLDWSFGATEVVAPDPAGRVQALAVSSAWVVIGDDWGGNLYVADLAPGPTGTYGQVLFVDHETSAGASWVAPSLTELLAGRPVEVGRPGTVPGMSVHRLDDVTPSTEVLRLGAAEAVDLGPLAGHPRLRTIVVEPGAATGLDALARVPALEYLAADAETWRAMLDAGQVPPSLLAAGFTPSHGEVDLLGQIAVANSLLERWGRPRIVVTELSTAPAPDGPAPAPAPPARLPWWRRLLG
ncbi:MAG TPA: SMI1/KNR4 family protein [Arachnia sp.]|nr:SMI1/KNR4 family protein [Arachnia sp.]